jgi:hypothetical protein
MSNIEQEQKQEQKNTILQYIHIDNFAALVLILYALFKINCVYNMIHRQ